MKKILYITNISNGVSSFSIASLKAAQQSGLEFHLAGNFSSVTKEKIRSDEKRYGIKIHQIDLVRLPYSFKNYNAYKQLIDIVEMEQIDFIHCNTPVGGLLGRLVSYKCKVNKVIYQAHGFHFYKDAPKKNWVIYYPIEKILAHFTDVIITINLEDYKYAKKFKLKNKGRIFYVPGVGLDTDYNKNTNEKSIRKELNILDEDIILISVGELNTNKNNKVIIEALNYLQDDRIKYIICGIGPNEQYLRDLTKYYGLEKNILFIGYRNDILNLLDESNIFVMSSFREGLSRSIMEAMFMGLPCIVSDIRGNRDLIDNKGGYLCNPYDPKDFANSIAELSSSIHKMNEMGDYNIIKVNQFNINTVINKMKYIYTYICE